MGGFSKAVGAVVGFATKGFGLLPFSPASLVIGLISNVALSAVQGALTPKPKRRSFAPSVRGRQEMVRQAVAARRTIYGKVLLSGVICYVESYSETTPNLNETLSMVIAVAGHEVAAFEAFYFNDEQIAVTSNAVQGVFLNFAWLYEHTGTADQAADAELVARSAGKWTSAHRLRGIAYLHIKARYSTTVFPDGFPKVRVLVKGKKVFDPRTSTTAWSDNPALCLRDYLTSRLGITTAEIDDTTVIAAANTCDEAVALAAGGTEARYTCDGTIDDSTRPADAIQAILSSMAGTLTYVAGQWKIYAGEAATSSIVLDEDDLRGAIVVNPRASRRQIFNAVKPIYVEPAQDYQATNAPPVLNAIYETQDGAARIWKNLELSFTTSSARAQRLAKIELERSRQQITVDYPAKPTALRLQVWDVVQITNARFGWASKDFRVVGLKLTEDIGVDLTLREEAASMWSWSAEETIVDPAPDTTLPTARSVAAPGGIAVAEELRVTASGAVLTVLVATVTAVQDAFVERYEFAYKKSADAIWTEQGAGPGTIFEVTAAADGVAYDLRARAVNAIGVRSAWTQVSFTPVGQSARPQEVANLSLNVIGADGHLTWDAVADVDLSHYRIRWSPDTAAVTWSSSVDLVTRVARPATSVSVPARTGTYLIKAIDLKGNESAVAASTVASISAIAGLNVVQTQTENPDFSGSQTNVAAPTGKLQLIGADTLAAWAQLSAVLVVALGDGAGLAVSGTYTFANTVDLGTTYTSRVTARIKSSNTDFGNLVTFWPALSSVERISSVDDAAASAGLEVRTTTGDPSASPVWTVWRPFVVGDYRARAFQFRAQLTTNVNSVSPLVEECQVTIDMPDRTASATGVTSAAAAVTVAFSPAFKAKPEIGLTVTDMASGDYVEITNQNATGFDVSVRAAGGSRVVRNFDYLARGYGEAA